MLVLDEPTAGLDPVAARVLKERVTREREMGRTILLTSHELGHLQELADDIVFLLDGVVRFEGEIAELLTATGQTELEGAIANLILEAEAPLPPPGEAGASADASGDGGRDPSEGVA